MCSAARLHGILGVGGSGHVRSHRCAHADRGRAGDRAGVDGARGGVL